MPHLGHNPTLPDIQKYVDELEQERGFANQDAIQKCLMLGEEVGELFKAIRKQENMSVDTKSQSFSVQEEMADIIIMLCSIANRFDVNLEDAFRNKEEINKKRKWTTIK
ncbi:MAG TPA: MazG nucleotide pyrophosphohydrolase domain-containing protein [Pseudobdellovibrionaceae bacterium]|jgi:NTP pyrophosphatase (non-canonical NTP hydrolase)